MALTKVKLTKEEFEDMYEITEDTEVKPTPEPAISDEQNTTPEFLTEEEQQIDDKMYEDMPLEDIE